MPLANFEVAVDKHGRHGGDFAPTGGTITISTSSVAAGGFLPSELSVLESNTHIIRVTSTKDVYVAFSSGPISAAAGDALFLAGTERMRLPSGALYVSAITVNPADTGLFSVTLMQ